MITSPRRFAETCKWDGLIYLYNNFLDIHINDERMNYNIKGFAVLWCAGKKKVW